MEVENMTIEQLRAALVSTLTDKQEVAFQLDKVRKEIRQLNEEKQFLKGQVEAYSAMQEYVFDHMEKS